jgi:hypothetical protein
MLNLDNLPSQQDSDDECASREFLENNADTLLQNSFPQGFGAPPGEDNDNFYQGKRKGKKPRVLSRDELEQQNGGFGDGNNDGGNAVLGAFDKLQEVAANQTDGDSSNGGDFGNGNGMNNGGFNGNHNGGFNNNDGGFNNGGNDFNNGGNDFNNGGNMNNFNQEGFHFSQSGGAPDQSELPGSVVYDVEFIRKHYQDYYSYLEVESSDEVSQRIIFWVAGKACVERRVRRYEEDFY